MNRKYTTEQYKSIVNGLRKYFHDVAITTDIMVGFAGETKEEFESTCKFVTDIGFADAHIFQYSQRKGTLADKYDNQVSPEIKDERSKIIQNICKKSKSDFEQKMLGTVCEVLIEQEVSENIYEGKTSNYQNVHILSNHDISGQYINVKLLSIKDGSFLGEKI